MNSTEPTLNKKQTRLSITLLVLAILLLVISSWQAIYAADLANKALEGSAPTGGMSLSDLNTLLTVWILIAIFGTFLLGGFSLRFYLLGTKDLRESDAKKLKEEQALQDKQVAEHRRYSDKLQLEQEKKNPENNALNNLQGWGIALLIVGIILQIWGASVVSSALDSLFSSPDAQGIANGTALQVSGNWLTGVGIAMLIAKQVASAINWQIRQSAPLHRTEE